MAARAPPNETGGGYDYHFVQTPSDILICTVCILPSKQPCLSECCGNTFCKSCLEGSKKFSNNCPVCRSEKFATIFNKQTDRMIRSLHIFCTNKEQGCEWQGEVNDINVHLGNCLFQVIDCPNECGECSQRKHLTTHIETKCPRRTVSCQYCNDVGENQFIEGQHKEECSKFPVQCPNECEIESLHRDEVEEHREVCPLEMIQCDYHIVGCKDKMARKNVNTHKQVMMEVHLFLSINELMETKMELKSAQNSLKHEVEKTKDDLTQQLVWHTTKIADAEQQLVANQQEAKKTKGELTQRIEYRCSSTIKQLTSVKQAANSQLENLRQQLSASQQEAKKNREDLIKQLLCTEKNLADKLRASQSEAKKVKEDLTQQILHTENFTAKLTASQQEAGRKENQLLQTLTATEKELNTTKQQLATTCQNLTKAEKEHTTLAATTDKAFTEMENKFQAKIAEIVTASERKITELKTDLQQKTQVIERMFSPWFMSLHDRASKSSSGHQVVPVVVKITEFMKNMEGCGWLSKPFYHTHNKECQLQLKVVTRKLLEDTYVSVLLLGDHKIHDKHKRKKKPRLHNHWFDAFTQSSQAAQMRVDDEPVVIKLLNQSSDNAHIKGYLRGKAMQSPAHSLDSNTLYYNLEFISFKYLDGVTAKTHYLKDDTLFFEVLTV